MKHIFIIMLIITTLFVGCATQPDIVNVTPDMEENLDPPVSEYDLIIDMCTGIFAGEHRERRHTIYCILTNFYALNKGERLYIDRVITADDYKNCLKPDHYFPEFETFWYPHVLECLEGESHE